MRIQQFLNNLYERMDRNQFKLISISLCLIGDLALCRYLYLYFTSEAFLKRFLEILSQQMSTDQNFHIQQVSPSFHMEVHQILVQSLYVLFIAAVSINLLHYIFYYLKEFKWAHIYIKFVSYLGVPSFFLIGITSLNMAPIGPYLIFQSFLYLFVAIGIRNYFPRIDLSQNKEQ